MPSSQACAARQGWTLSSSARTLVDRQITLGVPAFAANDSTNGSNRTSSMPPVTLVIPGMPFADFQSEAADIETAGGGAAPAIADPLAAVAGGAAVIAVMAA